MTDNEKAYYAEQCWQYAKSVGDVLNPKFEQWFKNRAKTLYMLSDSETDLVWQAALKMHS